MLQLVALDGQHVQLRLAAFSGGVHALLGLFELALGSGEGQLAVAVVPTRQDLRIHDAPCAATDIHVVDAVLVGRPELR